MPVVRRRRGRWPAAWLLAAAAAACCDWCGVATVSALPLASPPRPLPRFDREEAGAGSSNCLPAQHAARRAAASASARRPRSVPSSNITVAAFVYDPWTPEPAVFGAHGANWTEWELVRRAQPRFAGHTQPHVPLWGELDTARPDTWEMLNDQALRHGISVYVVVVVVVSCVLVSRGVPPVPRTRGSVRCAGTCGIGTGGRTRRRIRSSCAAWRRAFSTPTTRATCAGVGRVRSRCWQRTLKGTGCLRRARWRAAQR